MANDSATRSIYKASAVNRLGGLVSTMTAAEETDGIEVVYYISLGDGLIKIGTSSEFLQRMRKYGLTNATAGQRVLAIEFGGRDLERQRHEQFAHLRIGRVEQFVGEDDLWEHIEELRRQHNIAV